MDVERCLTILVTLPEFTVSRLSCPPLEHAPEGSRALLESIRDEDGMVSALARTLAHSPAALEAFIAWSRALAGTSLDESLRHAIAIAVSEANGGAYCLAAHIALGRMSGMSEQALEDARRGSSPDSRVDAALKFALAAVEHRGRVCNGTMARLRRAGYSDSEIVELVAVVSSTIFTNYMDNVADVPVDFPEVQPLHPRKPRCE